LIPSTILLAPSEPRKKALVIAVSEYDKNSSLKTLPFCKKDGDEMLALLKDLGYQIKNTDGLVGRVDGRLMQDCIYEFFKDDIKSDDTLLLYFSGHGVPGDDDFFLASSNIDQKMPKMRGFSFDDLNGEIRHCHARRVVVILDSCYAGSLNVSGKSNEAALASAAKNQLSTTFKEGEGRCLLSSCMGFQESFATTEGDHSFFTNYLLKGLRGADGKSVDDNGFVTPESLMNYIDREIDNLEEKRPTQTPFRKIESAGKILLAAHPELATSTKTKETEDLLKTELEKRDEKITQLTKGMSKLLSFHDETIKQAHKEGTTREEHKEYTGPRIPMGLTNAPFLRKELEKIKLEKLVKDGQLSSESKKFIDKDEKLKKNRLDHCNNLLKESKLEDDFLWLSGYVEFDKDIQNYVIDCPSPDDWWEDVPITKYVKQSIQHLYTGHKELFNLIIEYAKQRYAAWRFKYEYIEKNRDKLRTIFGSCGISLKEDGPADYPPTNPEIYSCSVDSLEEYLETLIDMAREFGQKRFFYKPTAFDPLCFDKTADGEYDGSYFRSRLSVTEETGRKLVSKFNDLLADLHTQCKPLYEAEARRNGAEKSCKKAFKEFFSNIKIRTATFTGACHSCLSSEFHNDEDLARLRTELDELHFK
jgi:hypothetical protein